MLDQKAGADGNGRDASQRVARRCASGGGVTGRTALTKKRTEQAQGFARKGI